MTHEIAVIPGDGIGQEVVPAAIRVLESLDIDLSLTHGAAGDAERDQNGDALPAETREIAASSDATLFGAAGETAADVILPLRDAVGSFANIRPAKAYPGVDALHPDTDLVFIRENTEGVYSGIESDLSGDVSTLTRVITRSASERIARFAFEYAEETGYDHVTIAHKANVMRVTDGRFLEAAQEVADEYPNIESDDAIMDALAMHLVLNPTEYDVIVCPNLAGDVLSDLAAGLVGGLGLLPSANIGPKRGLFEPVHGTAPDIAGEGIANPSATILSLSMLLEFLGYQKEADMVESAVLSVLEDGPRTPDLGGNGTTASVTDAIITKL